MIGSWLRRWVRGASGPIALACAVLFTRWLGSVGTAAQAITQEPPRFVYSEASGCEGLLVYAWNEARTEVLTVRIDRAAVPLRKGTTTFSLEKAPPQVAVAVEVTPDERPSLQLCSSNPHAASDTVTRWVAESGTLKVTMAPRPGSPLTSVTVVLDDLLVKDPGGARARARRDIRFTAAVVPAEK